MKVESQVKIDDLIWLLTLASRMLTAIANLEPFKGANIGLAEWITLATLEKRGATNTKQLARILGVSRLRANQLLASLAREDLATIHEGGEQRSFAEVSPKGQAHLMVVNTDLQEFLDKALEGREVTLASAGRRFYALWRLIDTVAPQPQAEEASYASSVARLHR